MSVISSAVKQLRNETLERTDTAIMIYQAVPRILFLLIPILF